MKSILYVLLLCLFFYSCKKNSAEESELIFTQKNSQNQFYKEQFAKTLAIALDKEPGLRSFIKNEALKEIDKDYDVIFHLVKNSKLTNNKSFYETLVRYSTSKDEFDQIIKSIPTLTILVPQVPNFSPESWETEKQIPFVAVSPKNKDDDIYLYDSNGKSHKIPHSSIPGTAVVVVKENERLTTKAENKSNGKLILNSNDIKLYFSNNSFDGSSNAVQLINSITNLQTFGKIARYVEFPLNLTPGAVLNFNTIDNKCIEAYDRNLDWHRDYIYYSLDPSNGIDKGKFNNDYVEHIVAIKFADNVYEKISDHPSDPKALSTSVRQRPVVNWTDGNYDIRISILINAKNGGGSQIEKAYSIKPYDLFDLEYTHRGNTIYYDVSKVIPKTFYLNDPIVAWDLENFGSQWKFIVKEFDPTTETILTYTNSTQFATNFGFDASFGEKVKLGIKFGASQTNTTTNSYQVRTTTGSNDLGEGILEFSSPIILRKENYLYTPPRTGPGPAPPPYYRDRYVTYDVTTGSVFISVEPKKIKNY